MSECKILAEKILSFLNTNHEKIKTTISLGYLRYRKYSDGKCRWIDEPNKDLACLLKDFNCILQEETICPPYCTAGYKKQNNIKNAQRHIGKREVIALDISHYFPNTKAKFVRKYFEGIGISGEKLNLLVDFLTYKDCLPTGAPTSTLVALLAHKEVFDSIYKKMQEQSIDMTVYVDDITYSTKNHICNWVVKYTNKALKTHGLFLKSSKIKRYGYKYAVITGVHINQAGKMTPHFKIGHSIIKSLKTQEISKMTSEKELKGLIAKISYLQQFYPKRFCVTKKRACKQLKVLQKQNKKEN